MKKRTSRVLTRTCATVLGAVMALASPLSALPSVQAAGSSADYELIDNMQDASILHCWNWSYDTIRENLDLIAKSGYSAIQTSPATQPKDYAYNGVVGTAVGYPGKPGSGNWWKLYQPVTESVCDNGQTWLGSKDDLKALCAEADKYGIKIIVDVVANHMGNITGWQNSLDDVSPQVGTYWNEDMLTDESYWHINDYQVWMSDSRLHFTQGSMGMPDLNTADSRVQQYIADYLDELIDCGVDGFRFDAAKHIETPDDDPAFASDFWPNVLGEAKSHYRATTGGELYVYGEILNTVGDNFSINSYTKYMSVTDNSAGNHLLEAFRNNNVGTLNMDYPNEVSVLWAESHDTYMNESSRYASDKSIVRTWALVGNKDNAASLFFVRPYYSKDTLIDDRDGSFNDNLDKTVAPATMGECETYVWASKEVAAINHFNNRMSGYGDNMGSDGNVAYCQRGAGIILVNFDGPGNISMSSHGVPDGTYTDEVSGNTFTVSGGRISGQITSEYGIAVVYKNPVNFDGTSITYPVSLSCSVASGTEFYTDGIEVQISADNADSASYSVSTGEKGTFSGTKKLTLGKNLKNGESVTLTLTGENTNGKKTATYTFTKKEMDLTSCIFFKNTQNWSNVTAYLWNDTGANVVTNAGWPGEAMFQSDAANNIYAIKVDASKNFNKIIFSNNGSSQTSDLDCGKIGYLYDPDKNTWSPYKAEEVEEKQPVISASVASGTEFDDTITVTFTAKDAKTASITINGTTQEFTNSVTKTFDTTTEVSVKAVNGSKSAAETYKYTKKEIPIETGNFVYFDVSACGWFKNDNAVLASQFNNQSSFTKCETVSNGGKTYYKLPVPDGASSVTVCRMISNGNVYNSVTVFLQKGKNVWNGNSDFNGGSWSYDSSFSGNTDDEETGVMTVYFVNNYDWNNDIKAYYWGSSKESVSWPGTNMESCGTNNDGKTIYKITIPKDIIGLIFTNGSEQTIDISSDLTNGKLFTISGNAGNKYTVSVSNY